MDVEILYVTLPTYLLILNVLHYCNQQLGMLKTDNLLSGYPFIG